MILSVSRRTDIPAFYTPWLMNRLKEGSVLVPHPRRAGHYSRIPLRLDVVDCIVFWTKNPEPLLGSLDAVASMGYPFYFQFTLTPYGSALEPGFADKKALVRTFLTLSQKIGPKRIIWRYDPVLINEAFPVQRHLQAFEDLCAVLEGAAVRCVFSFVDAYRKINAALGGTLEQSMDKHARASIAAGFAASARSHGISLFACAETEDLSSYGIHPAHCIDAALIGEILGGPILLAKDSGQRPACGCAQSVDIGAYHTCPGGCVYCYATQPARMRQKLRYTHLEAAALDGDPPPDAVITPRAAASCRCAQLSLFPSDS